MQNLSKEFLLDSLKRHWLPLIFACVGLIFFIYGLIVFWQNNQNNSHPDFYDFSQESHASTNSALKVDIEGQVSKPGVYSLKENSILQDALIVAGGLSALADRDWVAKNLNLAEKLTDAQKIYIPKQGEMVSQSATSVQGVSASQNGLININSATASELDSLKGVGPVTASKIIDNRPYASINELLDKKVVSQKVYDEIKDKITIQ